MTSLREVLFFYPEEDEEYYTAEEDEGNSDDEDSEYIPFEEMFGDAESMCSEDEEADDAEFQRRQALLDSQYSFDEDSAAAVPEFDDPFAGYLENDQASRPPSPTVRPRVPSAGYPPHRCNCPHCPSRTEGFIPPFTPGSLNVEDLPRQRTDIPIAPLILTPSVRKPKQARSSHPGPSRSLGNLGLNRRSEERNSRQAAFSLPPKRLDFERTVLTLPSIRTFDFWYDDLPTSPSRRTSEVPFSSRMALPFILNSSPTLIPNQLSLATRRPPEVSQVEGVDDSDTTSDNLPWLPALAPVINVNFIPDCSIDLLPYSLSLTRNVRTVHPSRDSNDRFEDLEFPGPLRFRD